MKNLSRRALVTLAIASTAMGAAIAAEPVGKTRAQVLQELEQARQNGDLVVDGETGKTARELRPDLYPKSKESGKTREQVKAELAEARRNGTLLANGDTGQTEREVSPHRFN
jgi:hypothetical protein